VIEPDFAISSSSDEEWVFPTIDLLNEPATAGGVSENTLKENADLIKEKLAQFNINVDIKGVEIGAGFDCVEQKGTVHRDEMTKEGFLSNNAGGVLGGKIEPKSSPPPPKSDRAASASRSRVRGARAPA